MSIVENALKFKVNKMMTREKDPQVIAEFRRKRTWQLIVVVPFMAALLPLLMLEDAGPDGMFGIPVGVVGICLMAIDSTT